MAGDNKERQERGVVNAIQEAIKKNKGNPVTIKVGKTTLIGVKNAEKFPGRQASGSEGYPDVELMLYDGKKLNLSLKGLTAPSLAGGGFRGIELAVPGMGKRFMLAAAAQLKSDKLKPGDKIPDIYGKIGQTDKIKIVVGTKSMGGKIDYMYIGPMDVVSSYDEDKNILSITGPDL